MMEVCFITDSNYVIATMTAIKSLILNNRENKILINVVHYKLTDKELSTISKLSSKNTEIKLIDASNSFLDIASEYNYVSKTALLKFYLPNIFSDKDKILYLDDDIIVQASIRELYTLNIENHYAAVVQDFNATMNHHAEKLKHKKYFNSGMMLLNLKKMREDNIVEQLIDYKKNEIFDDFMDQNAFNKIFEENVLYISPKFNYLKTIESNSINALANFYDISEQEMENISRYPVILHLAGGLKPWNNVLSSYLDIYLKYLLSLPFLTLKYKVLYNLFKQNKLRFIKYYLKQLPGFRVLINLYEHIK